MKMAISIMTREEIEARLEYLKTLRSEAERQIDYNEHSFIYGQQNSHCYELSISHWRTKLDVLNQKIYELETELENGYKF